ncbi:hypothetical protein [Nonomuraea sp. NPDC052265]|uniref:hypothetical protein n=1 Tax=Nonomuraea sp. NPDC052265 TaxID=3364374 RepID=UPI0037CB67FE
MRDLSTSARRPSWADVLTVFGPGGGWWGLLGLLVHVVQDGRAGVPGHGAR